MGEESSPRQPQRTTLLTKLIEIGDRVTAPLAVVESAEDRLKSQWMAGLLLGLMPIGLLLSVVPELISPTAQPFWQHAEFAAAIILVVCFGPFYVLCRLGRYRVVSWLAVGGAIFGIWMAIVFDTDTPSRMFDAAMFIMPLLFVGAVYKRRVILIVAFVIALSMLPLPLIVSGMSYTDILSGPFNIFLIGSGLIYLGALLRDLLERHHTSLLTTTNAALQSEIRERKKVELQINEMLVEKNLLLEEKDAALQEKEVLLKEVHHRVKNNLQVISSLLSLQSSKFKDPILQLQFDDSQARIRAMALIHEQLYRSTDLARIDLSSYLHDLVRLLLQTYQRQAGQLSVEVEAEHVRLSVDLAISCGLLVNELVSNAIKHAFPDGRPGLIRVELRVVTLGICQLVVRDNGIGFPENPEASKSTTVGLSLVRSLTRQIDGSVEHYNDSGTVFTIRFAQG